MNRRYWANILCYSLILGLIMFFIGLSVVYVSMFSAEYGYFEGQKDSIEKDLRIEKLSNGIYVWKSSPWDDGSEPTYKPKIEMK